MRILFIGDVYGRTGRDALAKHLPTLREKLKPDVVIVNGENAAHGIGITESICKEFYGIGTDVITTGNHVWDQREIISYIDRDPKLLRPLNFPKGTPGKGAYKHTLPDGRTILVVNAMARIFMDPLDCPFVAMNELINSYRMGPGGVNAILLDFHGEATSEKMAMGHHLDGRVSVVVGTHTHVPTADVQIFNGGTAYQSDAGMTGDYDSIIGVRKDIPIGRFIRKMYTEKFAPTDGEATVCGLFVETDDRNGWAKNAGAVRIGPRLKEEIPTF
ncbi:TIGR00282 family metallophosphoesterase [Micavibrio aeruginosavorus]|uniref:TIGR00282 family metallophosphoesterase n=1 Tax=Micavibrio aeruginosavorus TaxID=349221 RepID=UPI003F4A9453